MRRSTQRRPKASCGAGVAEAGRSRVCPVGAIVDRSGLRAERIVAPSGRVGWTVVDAAGAAVAPADAFLR
jgi:hypothetical protein